MLGRCRGWRRFEILQFHSRRDTLHEPLQDLAGTDLNGPMAVQGHQFFNRLFPTHGPDRLFDQQSFDPLGAAIDVSFGVGDDADIEGLNRDVVECPF